MNILLINHYAGCPQMGMEFRPYYMAREWQLLGNKVTIVAASQSHVRQQQPEIKGDFLTQAIDGIKYIWLKTPRYSENDSKRIWNMFAFLKGLYQYKRWLSDKPDVVIASSTYTLDIFPAHRIATANNARLIYEVHDLWPLSPIELGGYSKYHPFILMVQKSENYAYRHSHQVVSMLANASEHMESHGMQTEKFNYIPNGIRTSEWQREEVGDYTREIIKCLSGYKSEGFETIGYTGSIGLANALESLLKAVVILKEHKIKFIIVGKGPEKDNLNNLCTDLGLQNVDFFDPVPKNQLPAVLDEMTLVYIGLQRQSLFRFGISPNKLIDYMMAARPVLQAIEAGNDMVTEAGCGLTVEPENPQAIAEGILKLLDLPQKERDDMGRRGKEYVLKNHDYKILSQRFLDVMEKK